MKFRKIDAYQLLLHPTMLGKFDLIYVGAEPKNPSDIQKFKLFGAFCCVKARLWD